MSLREPDGESLETLRLPDSADGWDRLIRGAGPASLLVFIESRMSEALRRRLSAEDVLQEALLHAWRDRQRCEIRGPKGFRAWLLAIIENRLRDAKGHENAQKRGGGRAPIPLSGTGSGASEGSGGPGPLLPFSSTTPSRMALYREKAAAMRTAIEELPDDVRDIVSLRLFEQKSLGEISEILSLSRSSTLRRFRKGIGIYHQLLRNVVSSRAVPTGIGSGAPFEEKANDPPRDLS